MGRGIRCRWKFEVWRQNSNFTSFLSLFLDKNKVFRRYVFRKSLFTPPPNSITKFLLRTLQQSSCWCKNFRRTLRRRRRLDDSFMARRNTSPQNWPQNVHFPASCIRMLSIGDRWSQIRSSFKWTSAQKQVCFHGKMPSKFVRKWWELCADGLGWISLWMSRKLYGDLLSYM